MSLFVNGIEICLISVCLPVCKLSLVISFKIKKWLQNVFYKFLPSLFRCSFFHLRFRNITVFPNVVTYLDERYYNSPNSRKARQRYNKCNGINIEKHLQKKLIDSSHLLNHLFPIMCDIELSWVQLMLGKC